MIQQIKTLKIIKKWAFFPRHPYRMWIIWGSGSGKTSVFLNLIKEQDSDNITDKSYLYPKDLSERKYQFFIKRREDVGIKYLNDPKAFMDYSAYMDDVYNNINDYNPNRKIWIVFDDMITDVMTNKIFQAIIK